MNEIQLIKTRINENNDIVLSGRDLHDFLEVKTAYKDWFPRMMEYGFEEGIDFCSIVSESTGGRPEKNHYIKLDMAKEIAMIQRSEKGKQARRYFLDIEKAWNSPEKIMERALHFAKLQVEEMEKRIFQQKPKVLLADSIANSDSLILVRDLAVILKQNGYEIGEKRLYEKLREMGYLVKNGSSKNMPTQLSAELGLFRIVESTYTGSNGIKINKTPKVTGKGQEYFVNKFLKEK